MPNPLDLERVRAYCEKATAGPVAWQKFGKEWCLTGQYGIRPIILSSLGKTGLHLRDQKRDLLIPLTPDHPDAVFYANSRTDLPAAVEEIERLRAACLLLLDHVDYTNGACVLTEPVGAVLPHCIIEKARETLRNEQECK